MVFRKILLSLFINIFFIPLPAQEIIVPLQSNPLKAINESDIKTTREKDESFLELPFFEDFSYKGPYPDQKLWADSFALVNSCYQVHPVSIGVATFDALDQYGEIYEFENSFQFVADHLTSNKIRLDSVFEPEARPLAPEDSVYISFYYQPQGTGHAPNDRDSLVLQFLQTTEISDIRNNDTQELLNGPGNNKDTVKWVSVWNAEGETLSEFSKDTFPYFKRVMIPIEDSIYFREDFQFRFKNYSSFPAQRTPPNFMGNRSIWNVDYIKIDHGRTVADTFYYDITFAKPAQSILEKYTAMPWSHFRDNPDSHLKDNLDVAIKNLNNINHSYSYRYHIIDIDNPDTTTYSGGTWNIAPFYQEGYQDYPAHSNPIVISSPFYQTSPAEKRHFRILHAIKEGETGDDHRRNDTIYYDQIFDNYFAYDNGISNAGYILEGYEPQSATRFFLSHPDTLHGIDIFFNPTLDKQNNGPFKFMVWNSLDPEEIVYESDVHYPEYAEGINEFFTHELEEDEYIILQDTFYIGWKQTSGKHLNVGFDEDNSSGGNLFYNTAGQWWPSMKEGAVMIRPIIGREHDDLGIKPVKKPFKATIYPNPVKNNYINVRIDENYKINKDNLYFQIYDTNGRLIMSDKLRQTISINNIPNGAYLVRIFDRNSSKSITEKIIISR